MTAWSDRWVVVTGATSGIGRATSEALLAAGSGVIGLGRDEAALAALGGHGGDRFHSVAVDLADRQARARALAKVAEAHERIDAIVNNAGQASYESPLGITIDTFARLLELNLLAAVDVVQALRPRLVPGGHVVNVSSVTSSGLQNPRFASYGISKMALSRFTDVVRVELASAGHRVTEITLGLVDTPIYGKVPGFERMEGRLRQAVPRWLDPDDVARAILWALDQPAHVAVANITLLPAGQAQ